MMHDPDQLIGSSPIIRASHCRPAGGAEIFLKLEGFSASGSIKARAARQMLNGAIDRGDLPPGRGVVEPSSGNLGIALSMLCAQLSIPCWLVLDPRTTEFSRRVMAAYGARTVTVEERDEKGSWQGARLRKAKELSEAHGALLLYQYGNPDNPLSHEDGTAAEIVRDLGEAPDICVVGVSTGGQLTGIGRGLRKRGASTRMVGVDVEGSSIFADRYEPYSLRGLGLSWWPENLDPSLLDEVYRINEALAFQIARSVAGTEGLLTGGAGGAVIAACVAEAAKLGRSRSVLGVIAERGDRYVRQFYNRSWLMDRELEPMGAEAKWPEIALTLAPVADWRERAQQELARRKELSLV